MPENQAKHYPPDGITGRSDVDIINPSEVHTLDEMFRERVRRSANKIAYSEFDAKFDDWLHYSWADVATQVERWQVALQGAGLVKGDRVAIRLKNGIDWVVCDQAALRLGLVIVPLYCDDRADNVNYVLSNSGSKLLFLDTEAEWEEIRDADGEGTTKLSGLKKVIVRSVPGGSSTDKKVSIVSEWLPEVGEHLERGMAEPDDVASIVYTSGTTGKPKGVMLSHKNMLHNAYAGMRSVQLLPNDVMLSFLPLSHTFERTIGYYSGMLSGVHTYYNRSIPELIDDLLIAKPSVMIAVPRIFERVNNKVYQGVSESSKLKKILFHAALDAGWHRFEYSQGRASWHPKLLTQPLLDALVGKKVRAKLGGNLRFAVVGGAPLSPSVAKTFISLGVLLLQGYGLTESSPVVSVNTLEKNKPNTIGLPLRGVDIAIGENDELLVHGDNVMQGYWKNAKATREVLDEDGWLHTGDQASIDEQGFIRIIGRLKDILVLANGEKLPPADMEAAILKDKLFEQVMVVGEGKPFLAALLVLNPDAWKDLQDKKGFRAKDLNSEQLKSLCLEKITRRIEEFPGYAKIRKVVLFDKEWSVEEDLITPTLKVKRPKVLAKFADEVAGIYEGHGISKH
jgi:long-chain acyl-CoA synthetase